MKSILLILIYLSSFMLFFFVLSLPGMLWFPYKQVIADGNWFAGYTLFFGSWLALLPAREYYHRHKEYFNSYVF